MPRKVTMISGDSHLDFSPERWTHRVPEKWRDRAPRRIKLANGDDAFIVENSRPHSPSLQITGTGTAYDKHDARGISYEGPGTGMPAQRLREQDQDGMEFHGVSWDGGSPGRTSRASRSQRVHRYPSLPNSCNDN